jgi:hypothetical protein
MTNPRIDIEIQGVTHSLYFGMSAIQIFSEKSIHELQLLSAQNPKTPLDKLQADPVKSFAYVVYGGLCNTADINEQQRPTFTECYEIAENILYEDEAVQKSVFDCFNNSRAHKALKERLSGIQKKSLPVPKK